MKRMAKTHRGRRTGVWVGPSYREAMKIGDDWSLNHSLPVQAPPGYIGVAEDVIGTYSGWLPSDEITIGVEPTHIYLYLTCGGPVAHGLAYWDAAVHLDGRIRGTFRAADRWVWHQDLWSSYGR